MRYMLIIALGLLSAACVSIGPHAESEAFDADGVHVRHVRLRVAPAQTKDFEALVGRCVKAAQAAGLSDEYDWLCYRESPGRYWLVTFGDEQDGFVIPDSDRPLRTFARHVANQEGASARAEIDQRLAALEYEIEWAVLSRQKKEWSTVESMSTATHSKARVMMRTIIPGQETAFERALAERVAFLHEHGYPLPVEGFVILSGAPGTAMQAVFPRDWPSFHARESFWEFVQRLPESERKEYMRRKEALMRTMLSAEYYDADFLEEASYGAK